MFHLVNSRNFHQKWINLNRFHTPRPEKERLSFRSYKFILCKIAHLLMILAKGDTAVVDLFMKSTGHHLKKENMYVSSSLL